MQLELIFKLCKEIKTESIIKTIKKAGFYVEKFTGLFCKEF